MPAQPRKRHHGTPSAPPAGGVQRHAVPLPDGSRPMTGFSSINESTEPRNLGAESSLLGALLRDNDLYELVSDIVTPEHFFDPGHAEVYRLIVEALEHHRTASPITLGHHID